MNCPHCKKEIPESLLKKWWASLGGSKSKRKITPEQQAKMQAARRAKKDSSMTGEAYIRCNGCGNVRKTINGVMPKVCGGCGGSKFSHANG